MVLWGMLSGNPSSLWLRGEEREGRTIPPEINHVSEATKIATLRDTGVNAPFPPLSLCCCVSLPLSPTHHSPGPPLALSLSLSVSVLQAPQKLSPPPLRNDIQSPTAPPRHSPLSPPLRCAQLQSSFFYHVVRGSQSAPVPLLH